MTDPPPPPRRARWTVETLFAAALGVVTWLVYFTAPGVFESLDYRTILEPHLHLVLEAVERNEIPWWNPLLGLGRPLLSDMHFALLYPPSLLFLAGPGVGCFLLVWLHLLLLSAGTRAVAREAGARPELAMAAGALICFSGNFAARLLAGQLYYVFEQCYLPTIVWLAIRVARQRDAVSVVGLALAISGAFLCGNGNVFWVLATGGALFIAVFLAVERPAVTLRVLLALAGAALLAALLTAVAWLPYLDLVKHGNRGQPGYEFAALGSITPRSLASFFIGPALSPDVNWESDSHVGWIFFLAALGSMTRHRHPVLLGLTAVFLFATLYALGSHTPLHPLLHDRLPGVASFRFPPRVLGWAGFALIVHGAVWLSEPAPPRWTRPLAAIGLAFLVAIPLGGSDLFLAPYAGFFGFPLIIAGTAIAAGWRPPRRAATVGSLAVLLLAETLPYVAALKRDYARPFRFSNEADATGLEELRQLGKQLVTNNSPPPRLRFPTDFLSPNRAMLAGYASIDANVPLFLARPWAYLHAVNDVAPPKEANNSLAAELHSIARPTPFLSIDAIRTHGAPAFQPVNPVWPRAWFAASARVVSGPDEAIRAITNGHPAHHIPLVERAPNAAIPDTPEMPAQPLSLRALGLSELQLRVKTDRPGLVVLNEAWFPGWFAETGGRRIEAQPVNGWMRGFEVPAGDHEIRVRFRPRRFGTGLALSLFTIAATVIALVRTWRNHPPESLPIRTCG